MKTSKRKTARSDIPHHSDSHQQESLARLIAKHGWEGYGLYWGILEIIGSDSGLQKIEKRMKICQKGDAIASKIDAIAYILHANACTIRSIIVKYGLFVVNSYDFSSQIIEEAKLAKQKKSENCRKSAEKRWSLELKGHAIACKNDAIAYTNAETDNFEGARDIYNNLVNNVGDLFINTEKQKEKQKYKKEKEKQKEIFDILTAEICGIYRRRATTPWSEKEIKKLKEICKRPEVDVECQEIKEFYSWYQYRRKDIITLLNNWTGELDRARNTKSEKQEAFESSAEGRELLKLISEATDPKTVNFNGLNICE